MRIAPIARIGHWLKPWREVSDGEAGVKNASQEHDDRGDMQPAHADVQEGVHTPSIFGNNDSRDFAGRDAAMQLFDFRR